MNATEYSPQTWLGLSIFADCVMCSSLHNSTDYTSIKQWRIPLTRSQIHNGLIINSDYIANAVIEIIRVNKINARYATIALPDEALTQTITSTVTQEIPHHQSSYQILSQSNSLYYQCQIPMTTLFSYALLALKIPMHVLSLTSHCSALVTGYGSLHGKRFDSLASATSYAQWRDDVMYAASAQPIPTHASDLILRTESIGLFLQGKEVYEQFY
jgi:hypothetical protein